MKNKNLSKPSAGESFWVFIGGLLCILLGVFMGWEQYNEIKDMFISKQWPITEGTVKISEHGWIGDLDEDELPQKAARISYSFSVGSQIYEGKASTEAYIFTSGVNNFFEKYPEGSSIDVYYNPDNPKQSIVEPGLNLSFLDMIFAIIITYGGFWLLRNANKN